MVKRISGLPQKQQKLDKKTKDKKKKQKEKEI